MRDPEEIKQLVIKRFEPIINSILSWNDNNEIKYSDKELFISLVKTYSCNKRSMCDHIGTVLLDDYNFARYYGLKMNMDYHFSEYMFFLKELINNIIHSKYPKFIHMWNNIDKYEMLM